MTAPAVRVLGLDSFGLTAQRLKTLGTRAVQISIQQRGIPLSRLMRFTARHRLTLQSAFLREGLAQLRRRWPDAGITARGTGRLPWTLDAAVRASDVHRIAAERGVSYVWLSKIRGLRERKAAWEKRHLGWYCVRGRVAIQVERQVRGLVTVEDRFVLVKAFDERDARRRLRKNWKQYAEPGMNSRGELFRWQLLEVTDVYELHEDDIDPKGTEVYSRLEERRMKAEYVWHPRTRGA